MNFTEYLINTHGFLKVFNRNSDDLDHNQYSCITRIHVLHWLLYSPLHKTFTIRLKYDEPKGKPGAGGGYDFHKEVMIPVTMNTKVDIDSILTGLRINSLNNAL